MTIGSFFKLVEIQTKVASVIPYLIGTTFAYYNFNTLNFKNTILFFLSMLIFDMTTTAINNYVDYVKAIKKDGFGYEEHNAISRDNLNPKTVKITIFILLLISSVLGIVLYLNTDIVVLIFGIICFGIGILYSFGPLPISRTPFGEIFSGLTMGFCIAFLSIYVNVYDRDIVLLDIANNILTVKLNVELLISLFIVTIPAIAGISNIMLANNICDIDEDIINKRYTLPVVIGKEKALIVFKWTYYLGFIGILIGVILKVLPVWSLVALIALKPVSDNIKIFTKNPSKAETFVLSVKNFVLTNILYILTIVVGIII